MCITFGSTKQNRGKALVRPEDHGATDRPTRRQRISETDQISLHQVIIIHVMFTSW